MFSASSLDISDRNLMRISLLSTIFKIILEALKFCSRFGINYRETIFVRLSLLFAEPGHV